MWLTCCGHGEALVVSCDAVDVAVDEQLLLIVPDPHDISKQSSRGHC